MAAEGITVEVEHFPKTGMAAESVAAESITVEPLQGLTFGAVVRGVSLASIDEKAWRKVESAFREHAVLVFPGQQGLTVEAQKDFASRFGQLEIEELPITNMTTDGQMMSEEYIKQKSTLLLNNEWHMDSSYMPVQAKGGMLFAEKVPPSGGGETQFADMRAAYDALDIEMRDKIEKLKAYHSVNYTYARYCNRFPLEEQDEKHGSTNKVDPNAFTNYGKDPNMAFLRPMVKVHPDTGRKNIVYASHAFGIDGMSREEGREFLTKLRDTACQPPRTYSHKWQPGDLVIWDNRCCLHRSRPHDFTEPRVLRGTRIAGDEKTEGALPAPDAPKLLAEELACLKKEMQSSSILKTKPDSEGGTKQRAKL